MSTYKLLYLASLPHSGSTVLSLMLGQQNEMVGLGGIDRAISALAHSPGEAMRELCSCGKTVADCDYWGQVLPHAHHVKGAPMKEKYVLALSIFQRVFGEKAWPVDSTKHAEPIETLSEISEIDLRVIHLCRDFRSAVVSSIDLIINRKNRLRFRFFKSMELAHKWHHRNSKIRSVIKRKQVAYLGVGYEELCLAPTLFFNLIGDFSSTNFTKFPSTINGSNSHLFIGNGMRKQKHKESLLYDYRWMNRSEWIFVSLLMPWLKKSNDAWVYGNKFTNVFGRREDYILSNSTSEFLR